MDGLIAMLPPNTLNCPPGGHLTFRHMLSERLGKR